MMFLSMKVYPSDSVGHLDLGLDPSTVRIKRISKKNSLFRN